MSQSEPTGDDPLVQLADGILHVGRKLRAYPLRESQVVPLTALECLVLLHIDGDPGVTSTSVANNLSLTSSNASTAVRGLVQKGQIERRNDPADGRTVRLHLTEEAQQSVATVRRIYRDLLARVGLPEQDVLATVRTLHAIDAAVDGSGTTPSPSRKSPNAATTYSR